MAEQKNSKAIRKQSR